MPRPYLSKEFTITEGVADAFDGDDYVAEPINHDVKHADSWDVIRTAELGRNFSPETVQADQERIEGILGTDALVLSGDSFGIREVYGAGGEKIRPEYADPTYFSEIYNTEVSEGTDAIGYPLDDVSKVVLGSGTSGATITYMRKGLDSDGWVAKYDKPTDGESRMYERIFRAIGTDAIGHNSFKRNVWNMSEEEFEAYIAGSREVNE